MESQVASSVNNGGKYTLRTKSNVKRHEAERNRQNNKNREIHDEMLQKAKSPPLSKYRRRTANARERNRMKDINDAFSQLTKAIPHLPEVDSDKLTKIMVLQLAVNYIESLTNILDDNENKYTNVEDNKEQWGIENAHIVKQEENVLTSSSDESIHSPTKHIINTSAPINNIFNENKYQYSLQSGFTFSQGNVRVMSHEKVKPEEKDVKRLFRGKLKTKVCRTASIMTNNGAYITMKNLTSHGNHQPIKKLHNSHVLPQCKSVCTEVISAVPNTLSRNQQYANILKSVHSMKHNLSTQGHVGGIYPTIPSNNRQNFSKMINTASVTTDNGVYITMKNLMTQKIHRPDKAVKLGYNKRNTAVKRQKIEIPDEISCKKVPKIEAPNPSIVLGQPCVTLPNYISSKPSNIYQANLALRDNKQYPSSYFPESMRIGNKLTNKVSPLPKIKSELPYKMDPTIYIVPNLTPIKQEPTLSYTDSKIVSIINNTDSIGDKFHEKGSLFRRNNVNKIELPKSKISLERVDSYEYDSAFSSDGGSVPSSPVFKNKSYIPLPNLSPSMITSPTAVDDLNCSAISGDSSLLSDPDSILNTTMDLGSLLKEEIFDEDLKSLTSFPDCDDTLNIFLEHLANSQ